MKIEITTRADGTLTPDSRDRIRSGLANQFRGVIGSGSPFAGQVRNRILETFAKGVTAKAEEELRARKWSRLLSRELLALRTRRRNP